MILFFSMILTLLLLMHVYVFWRLFGLFGIRRRGGFWTLTVIGWLSLFVSRMLKMRIDHVLVDAMAFAAVSWLGVLWLLFCTLLVYELVRGVVPHQKRTAGVVILAVVGVAAGYAALNARRITVRTLRVPGPSPMRIVQLSDIHLGSMNAAFFQRVIEKTNALEPDMVLITGDLVDAVNRGTREAMTRLTDLKAPVFFSSGNHEFYAGRQEVLDALRRLNVTVVDHHIVEFNGVQLIGIPDTADTEQAEAALLAMPYDRQAYSILMFHRPLDPAFLEQARIRLTLAGHTHRGQIFPFGLIVGRIESPLYGLHRRGDSVLYVTSGTGLWGPRMRLGTDNEIVVIELDPTLSDAD